MRYDQQSQSYRRGFVEGESGREPNVYLLQDGATNIAEYCRGFADGEAEKKRRDNVFLDNHASFTSGYL